MIPNKMKTIKQKILKSPLLAKIKFEPIFFTGSLAVFQSEKVASVGGRKGGSGGIPPAPRQFLANSVRIFSNAHRQLGNGSPSARASQQPLFPTGGGGRIRTHGTLRYNGFQDRRHRPLGHSSRITDKLKVRSKKYKKQTP